MGEPDSTGRLRLLTDAPGCAAPAPFAGPDHPMRQLTRRLALGHEWTRDDARRVQGIFDGLAPDWSATHVDSTKTAPVRDALARGDVPGGGRWLELGSGTGAGTRELAGDGRKVVAVDLSMAMLRGAPDIAPRVRADASGLPFAAGTFRAALLVNMLLFPEELRRVLADDAVLIWVNTLGDQTPIHLPPIDVLDALGDDWVGTTARAGTGFWLSARRRRR